MTRLPRTKLFGIAIEVFVLGCVSFLTDVSSEMIFPVLPLFFTGVLGASSLSLGAMEGLADFAASSLDMAAGFWADRTGKRKGLASLGYGLSSVSKLLLVVATAPAHVVGFRVVERLGKSIRGAPRDALLASVSSPEKRGVSFGIHKAFDKAGAILGPLVAFFVLARLGQSAGAFRVLFAIAVVPAFLAVIALLAWIREPSLPPKTRLRVAEAVGTFSRDYWHYLVSAGLFSLGYFSLAFLLLKATTVGFKTTDVILLYALFNATFTLASIPLGQLGDRIGRRALVAASYILYALLSLGFLWAQTKTAVGALFAAYGVFFALDEGQAKAFVTDLSEPHTRATALGVYGFVTGLVYLPASLIAGALWKSRGPPYAFAFGAGMAMVALLFFAFGRPLFKRQGP